MPSRRRAAILGAALALWACGGGGAGTMGVAQEADSADQVFQGFDTWVLRGGVRRIRLQADTAEFFEARQVSVLHRVRAAFFDSTGAQTSTLTADRMEYQLQDGSMRASGHVVLSAAGNRRLATDALNYDAGRNELRTDRHFVLDRGTEHLEGDGLRADPEFQHVVVGRARGVAADSVLLPGQ